MKECFLVGVTHYNRDKKMLKYVRFLRNLSKSVDHEQYVLLRVSQQTKSFYSRFLLKQNEELGLSSLTPDLLLMEQL